MQSFTDSNFSKHSVPLAVAIGVVSVLAHGFIWFFAQKVKEFEKQQNELKKEAFSSGRNELRRKFQVVVIGSTMHYNPLTKEICEKVGSQLARYKDVTLITGGTSGIPESVCNGWYNYTGSWDGITHFFPRTGVEDKFRTSAGGNFVITADTAEERQECLSDYADIMIMIEGGGGAKHEAEYFLEKYNETETPRLVVTLPFSSPSNKELHESDKYKALKRVRESYDRFVKPEPDVDSVVRYIMYNVGNELREWNQKHPEASTLKEF